MSQGRESTKKFGYCSDEFQQNWLLFFSCKPDHTSFELKSGTKSLDDYQNIHSKMLNRLIDHLET